MKPVKCENCGRVIAEGITPANVEIKCQCGTINKLWQQSNSGVSIRAFAERVMSELEKKDGNHK